MPKGSGLKIGKVVSDAGNEVVASFHDSDIPGDLGAASCLYGKTVFIGDSRRGRISDIVGRVESPYMVLRVRR